MALPSPHPDGVPRNDPLPSRTAAVSTRLGMDRTARPLSSTQRCLSTIYCCEQKRKVILSVTDSPRQNQRCANSNMWWSVHCVLQSSRQNHIPCIYEMSSIRLQTIHKIAPLSLYLSNNRSLIKKCIHWWKWWFGRIVVIKIARAGKSPTFMLLWSLFQMN